MNSLLISFVIWTISIAGVIGGEELFLSVALFDHPNKQGPNVTMEIRGCKNVPSHYNDRVSSLELFGRCVRLYKDQDCTGRMMTISPQNRLWTNDLQRVNFDNILSSVSSCRPESPKLESGRYAIQSPWDRGVLTVRRLVGGFTLVKTLPWRKDFTQQWDIEKNDDNTYLMTPRQFEINPLSYTMDSTQTYPTERVNWVIETLHNKMYMMRKYPTNLCITMRQKMEAYLKECRNEDKRQHWVFHKIQGAANDR